LNRREVVFRSASRRFIRQRAYFFFEAFFFAFFLVAMMDLHVGLIRGLSIYTLDGIASKG